MINATNLPSLFSSSSWQSGGTFVNAGNTRYLASIDGWWTSTGDDDGVLISQANYNAIAAASAHPDNDGALLIGGLKKEIAAMVNEDTGRRWIDIRDA